MLTTELPEKTAAYRYGGLTLFLATGVILGALAFEHLGGLAPCPLCLMQRYAYYASIPLLFIAMALVSEKPRVAALIFFVVALAFLANAGLGVYHAGVEWKFWPGPDTCGTAQALPTSASDLLSGLDQTRVVRCDEAAWTFAGLSLAGWNVIASLLAFAGAIKAAFLAAEGP
ncbi:MAG: disulfide bond formation protein B [Hyphomicrobium zavarzinii]|jgi:disulfide bond formation protein DsbB|uniref:disulfide bond formation protein B n=1 Tax=Hyphomicrobium zavarzinii TaxID=48292 RepID=UPI000370626F|nr:disulfide bond formation protein B [Hyphomicrobium zavarzinii]MBL8847921.1 disulfide bond formation protein B [Hyphomicrobium zavarzinii]HML43863.1 disulfide bond formation protein B [Hyphomicrobium zavarzinii]